MDVALSLHPGDRIQFTGSLIQQDFVAVDQLIKLPLPKLNDKKLDWSLFHTHFQVFHFLNILKFFLRLLLKTQETWETYCGQILQGKGIVSKITNRCILKDNKFHTIALHASPSLLSSLSERDEIQFTCKVVPTFFGVLELELFEITEMAKATFLEKAVYRTNLIWEEQTKGYRKELNAIQRTSTIKSNCFRDEKILAWWINILVSQILSWEFSIYTLITLFFWILIPYIAFISLDRKQITPEFFSVLFFIASFCTFRLTIFHQFRFYFVQSFLMASFLYLDIFEMKIPLFALAIAVAPRLLFVSCLSFMGTAVIVRSKSSTFTPTSSNSNSNNPISKILSVIFEQIILGLVQIVVLSFIAIVSGFILFLALGSALLDTNSVGQIIVLIASIGLIIVSGKQNLKQITFLVIMLDSVLSLYLYFSNKLVTI